MERKPHFHAGPFLAPKSRYSNFSLPEHHSDGHSPICAEPIWMRFGYVVALDNI
ncbi:MAG: hypothetical protein GY820_19680 [Gammaproteobacteria bacterium]|nr:hypothetical protein [Gammaproteobacteria bacterium]